MAVKPVDIKTISSVGDEVTTVIAFSDFQAELDFYRSVISFAEKWNARNWQEADEVDQALSLYGVSP